MNYAIWWFAQPSHALIWLSVAGIVSGFWNHTFSHRLLLLSASAWVAILLLPVGTWLILPLETRFPVPDLYRPPDGIILLAGSERPTVSTLTNQPHLNDLGSRLLAYVDLAQRYPEAELWYSGGGRVPKLGGPMPGQAAVARRVFAAAGLEHRVRFDTEAGSTCGSAETLSAKLTLPPSKLWLLVTSAYHVPRAMACFRAQNLRVLPYPTDFKHVPGERWPSPNETTLRGQLRALDLAAHEWVGLLYYRLRGSTRSLLPAHNPTNTEDSQQ